MQTERKVTTMTTDFTATPVNKTKRLTESAVLIAISVILSMPPLTITGAWIYGGSVTIASMLPLCFISYKYGMGWGALTGATYGLINLLMGLNSIIGQSFMVVLGAVFIDYILAFMVFSLGGLFRGKGVNLQKNMLVAFPLGAFAGCVGRFVAHFLSGFLVWGSIANDGFTAIAYSFTYNIGYMLPEIVVTTLAAVILTPALKRFVVK